jgi:hypothetical protein
MSRAVTQLIWHACKARSRNTILQAWITLKGRFVEERRKLKDPSVVLTRVIKRS